MSATNNILQELETEFEEEMIDPLNISYLVNFDVLGFGTTPAFRATFEQLNKHFVKRGRQWTSSLFKSDFCKGPHYVLHIPGVGVRTFALLRGFPVEYQIRRGQKPLLVGIGKNYGSFASTLQSRGKPVQSPYRPCRVPRVSRKKFWFNVGKDLLRDRLEGKW